MYVLDHNKPMAKDSDATPTNITPTHITMGSDAWKEEEEKKYTLMMEDIETDEFPLSLSCGVQFVTGKLVWELMALPEEVSLTAKLFHLARRGELERLKEMIDKMEAEQPSIPTFTITSDCE